MHITKSIQALHTLCTHLQAFDEVIQTNALLTVCRTCHNVKHGFQEPHDLIHALLESHDNEDGYNLQYTLQASSIFSVKIGS
jgi:hypothetical protein